MKFKAIVLIMAIAASIYSFQPPKKTSKKKQESIMSKTLTEIEIDAENKDETDTVKRVLPKIEMVFVQGGKIKIGSIDGQADERPVRTVEIKSFYIGKFEITQKQWKMVMQKNPSNFNNCDDCPVEKVCWKDANEFIKYLNKLSKKKFRLPTEAEWEFAAKGGIKSKDFVFSGSNNIEEVAWFRGNSQNKSHAVGSKKPNELDIYDMTGNVAEWCSDWYMEKYYSGAPSENPQGPQNGELKVLRGGSWRSNEAICKNTFRSAFKPNKAFAVYGFRVALD